MQFLTAYLVYYNVSCTQFWLVHYILYFICYILINLHFFTASNLNVPLYYDSYFNAIFSLCDVFMIFSIFLFLLKNTVRIM